MARVWMDFTYGDPRDPSEVIFGVKWNEDDQFYYKYSLSGFSARKVRNAYLKHKSPTKYAADIKAAADSFEKIPVK